MDLKITWFNAGEKTLEELDALTVSRFNIKNFTEPYNYKLKNFYVFKVLDLDPSSTTGYYGMCINKEYAQAVKKNLEVWKKNQH